MLGLPWRPPRQWRSADDQHAAGCRGRSPQPSRPASGRPGRARWPHAHRAAGIIKKALESAIANAEHNDGADIDELKVKSIYVEQGATLKRFSARAKGRGNRISKPTAHIYITVGN